MTTINELVAQLSEVAANPAAELDRHIAAGKKVIGVGPYYVPEELVYAAGGVPFGVSALTRLVRRVVVHHVLLD